MIQDICGPAITPVRIQSRIFEDIRRTKILNHYLPPSGNLWVCQDQLFAVLQDLLGFWSEKSHSFGIPSSCFGHCDLDILCGGVFVDFNGGGEVLDRPFGIYISYQPRIRVRGGWEVLHTSVYDLDHDRRSHLGAELA